MFTETRQTFVLAQFYVEVGTITPNLGLAPNVT